MLFDFRIFKTIRSFCDSIYNNKFEMHEVNQDQDDLLEYILDFNSKTRPRPNEDKSKKKMFLIRRKFFMRVEN